MGKPDHSELRVFLDDLVNHIESFRWGRTEVGIDHFTATDVWRIRGIRLMPQEVYIGLKPMLAIRRIFESKFIAFY